MYQLSMDVMYTGQHTFYINVDVYVHISVKIQYTLTKTDDSLLLELQNGHCMLCIFFLSFSEMPLPLFTLLLKGNRLSEQNVSKNFQG